MLLVDKRDGRIKSRGYVNGCIYRGEFIKEDYLYPTVSF